MIRLVLAIATVTMVAACNPLDLLNAVVPNTGYDRIEGIAYGNHPRQKMDLYIPDDLPSDVRVPVAVWVYGGSWEWGARDQYEVVGEYLTSRGYVGVVPDYRLYPEAKFPDFVEDLAEAVAWLRTEAAREVLPFPVENVVLTGHSAGAYNAAMVAYDRRWLQQADAPPDMIAGFVGIAGPYDIHPYTVDIVRDVFGHVADPEIVEPMDDIEPGDPPALLIVGLADETVDPRHTEVMAEALRSADVPVRVVELPDKGHIGVALTLARPFRDARVADRVDAFIAEATGQRTQ